ncbi:MAG: BON domain-containing protein [Proteobacteria bacterium]|nr:BON domain-containing protein [Pseudomonadota bacterium]
MTQDISIRDHVQAALEHEPGLDATAIAVNVRAGVVTLCGHVPTYPQKLAAEALARRAQGVRAVADDIRVQLTEADRPGDDQIAERAANLLEWTVTAPAADVAVTVEDGWVTLQGSVGWTFQKDELRRSVERLRGVRGVTDRLDVRSHPSRSTPGGDAIDALSVI